MKKLCLIYAVLITAVLAAEDKPVATMPEEVTLTTGRVLRKVIVVRWEKERVVLKHAGGADPIAFSLFKNPAPGDLPAMRAAFEAANKAAAERQNNEVAKTNALKKYEGQAFIVTRGAGNYKLGGIQVLVYLKPASEVREEFKWQSSLPTPDAIASTDAEGKFSFTAPPSGSVTLVAKGRRLAGSREEKYFWIVDVANEANRFEPRLSNSNLEPEPYVESGAYNKL